jgi:hypothetical protein
MHVTTHQQRRHVLLGRHRKCGFGATARKGGDPQIVRSSQTSDILGESSHDVSTVRGALTRAPDHPFNPVKDFFVF